MTNHGLFRRHAADRLVQAVALGVILAAAQDGLALAQQQKTGSAVGAMEQPGPDYEAQGIAVGDWLLLPSVAITANYDDNVFRSSKGSTSDWFFETVPIVRLQRKTSDWQADISANADNFTYARLSDLDLTDWTVAADVGTTGDKALTAVFAGYYGEYHEGFESADILGFQRSSTRYFRGHIDSGINYQPGAWALTGAVTFDTYSWRPTVLLDGEYISNRDRDETLLTPSLRFSYNVAPGYQLFARSAYDRRDFAVFSDRFGFHRASAGYRLDAGVALAIDDTVRGEAFLGYLRQDFESSGLPRLPDVSVLDYGADIKWNPSRDIAVHFTASRSLSDIILPGVSMSDDQTEGLSVDWQLRSNIVLKGAVSYTNSRLVGISRTDSYPATGLTLRYLINHIVSAQVGCFYSARHSDLSNVEFNDQICSAGLNLHI